MLRSVVITKGEGPRDAFKMVLWENNMPLGRLPNYEPDDALKKIDQFLGGAAVILKEHGLVSLEG